MKIGAIKLSGASVALLVIQLALVCSIPAKYVYQRWTSPRVWARTWSHTPAFALHGRYLSLKPIVDGCASTLPSAKQAIFGRNLDGSANKDPFSVASQPVYFRANLAVKDNTLIAVLVPDKGTPAAGQFVAALSRLPCNQMELAEAIDFDIGDPARVALPLADGAELWVEVTVPPKGAPRPLQVALKQNGAWQPLAFQ